MADTSDLLVALLDMGASISRNENGEMVAKFNGPVNTKIDENKHLHIYDGGSSVNLTDYRHKIKQSEITLLPI